MVLHRTLRSTVFAGGWSSGVEGSAPLSWHFPRCVLPLVYVIICLVLTMAHLRVFPRVPSRFPPGSTQKMWISSLKIGWQISARTLLGISHQQLIHGNVSKTDTQAPAIKLGRAESEHLTIFFTIFLGILVGYWLDFGASNSDHRDLLESGFSGIVPALKACFPGVRGNERWEFSKERPGHGEWEDSALFSPGPWRKNRRKNRRSGSSRIEGLGFRASNHFKPPLGLMD